MFHFIDRFGVGAHTQPLGDPAQRLVGRLEQILAANAQLLLVRQRLEKLVDVVIEDVPAFLRIEFAAAFDHAARGRREIGISTQM